MTPLAVRRALEAAVSLHRAGRLQAAEAAYRDILARAPDHPDALHLLGVVAAQAGDADRAVDLIRRAIAGQPGNAEFHANLALALRKATRLDEAVAAYRRAADLAPDRPEAWVSLGKACLDCGELEPAVAAFQRALALRPAYGEAANNLGVTYTRRGDLGEALRAYERALELDPRHVTTRSNLAATLYNLGRLDEAIAMARRALELDGECAEAHLTLGASLLISGRLAEGWPEYEWRWRCPGLQSPSPYPQPAWDGSDPAGRSILLCSEQGLGDTIQFVRYAPLVAARGARVVLGCRPALKTLLQTVGGIEQVVADGERLPPVDLQAPLMSVPRLLGTTLESIPARVPYLAADPRRRDVWRARLSLGPRSLKVGLVWAGQPQNRTDRWRSIPLRVLAPLGAVAGVGFVSLQGGAAARQAVESPFPLVDHDAELHDFADIAALVANLDLVISVDTAGAHLAGALGRPVWTLLPSAPDWRWLLEREDTPWYPTMRLFRQTKAGDWAEVVARVAAALRREVGRTAARSG
ncbi:MAG: tetratricopeptide repeat protein [Candidatus Rokuibacteriota bacterium]